ncbi:MAG: glycosyltransferase 87 family protein [Candidatus Woesebacteria bacterium]
MRRLLLLAAFLYLFLAPLTYHNDNKLVLFWASQDNGKVWDIWKYGETNLPPERQFNYPPLHFYLAKLQYAFAVPLGGSGYTEWLSSSDPTDPQRVELPRYMLATKFVLILAGIASGYLVYLLSKQNGFSEKRAKFAAALWLFNPITIYSIPMMGQNDVLAIVFFLFGWWLLAKRPGLTGVIVGLAASIKVYPLLWLAFLLPSAPKLSPTKKVGVFLIAIVVYGLTLFPFIHDSTFRSTVLNSDVNDRFLTPQIGIGFEQAINIIPILLGILFLSTLERKKKKESSFGFQAFVVMTANLLLLGFTHFHPQWYTWVVPFWAIWTASLKDHKKILYSLLLALAAGICWFAVILLFQEKYLTFGMISILNPALFNLPIIHDFLLTHKVNVGKFDNLAHSGLAGIALIALFSLHTSFGADIHDFVFRPLRFSLRIPKPVRFVLATCAIVGTTFAAVLVLQRIPIAQSSSIPTVDLYEQIREPVVIDLPGERPNLSRFEIYLRNPQLRNTEDYTMTLYDKGARVMQQPFSAHNVGDFTTMRFDLPMPQPDSLGKNYSLHIDPVSTQSGVPHNDDYLWIGHKSEGDKKTVATVTYYSPELAENSILKRSIEKIRAIFQQVWGYEIGIFLILFLAI